jgi:hypothetical protein
VPVDFEKSPLEFRKYNIMLACIPEKPNATLERILNSSTKNIFIILLLSISSWLQESFDATPPNTHVIGRRWHFNQITREQHMQNDTPS